jgi:pimeloyl-ACP methyl ester carboxylesterase
MTHGLGLRVYQGRNTSEGNMMPSVDVDAGVRLTYKDIGTGEPVVLVPGWSHSSDTWDAQIRALAPAHRVIAIDPRGQGRSDAPYGDYSIARHAADLTAVLDHLDLGRVSLVGWSMGGLIVFLAASGQPRRIVRVALVGSNGVGVVATHDFPHGMPAEAMEQFSAGEVCRRPAYRRASIENAMATTTPATVDWLFGDSMQTSSWAGVGSLHGLIAANQVGLIANLTMPVLMLHGLCDPLFSIAGARWVAERLRSATLVEFPECGHFPHIEVSDAVNAQLTGFLAQESS